MLNFNNNHIFTGYLKQLLSTYNIPTCKIYTKEFADYAKRFGKEDPRVVESINYQSKNNSLVATVNYLKNNEIYSYFLDHSQNKKYWRHHEKYFYQSDKSVPGLTKTLKSSGNTYDTVTHEYLGEYLRFLRDYYNLDLMSLYNCFNNKIYNNIFYELTKNKKIITTFDSLDPNYKIYAFPVKLFAEYTIAIDSPQGIEMFCGMYKTALEKNNSKFDYLIEKTYQKVDYCEFRQPFLYKLLNNENCAKHFDLIKVDSENKIALSDDMNSKASRWDILNRERDLKLFIKVPITSKSSITVLEGDFRSFNDFSYRPDKNTPETAQEVWKYQANHTIINFEKSNSLNEATFKLISKLQLLAFNTGVSYPFADRLIEYLVGSAITPIDEISDNIARAQEVMNQNGYFFKIKGLWENKMQKIAYDYMINSGPIKTIGNSESTKKLVDAREGIHPRLGHSCRSFLYDVLGYIDKDVEKCYSSWKLVKDNRGKAAAQIKNSIQNVDIYNGLYDI